MALPYEVWMTPIRSYRLDDGRIGVVLQQVPIGIVGRVYSEADESLESDLPIGTVSIHAHASPIIEPYLDNPHSWQRGQ